MTAYQTIVSLDNSIIEILFTKGLLKSTVKRDIAIYEFFLNERKTVGYLQARSNTAEHFHLCEDNIAKIIQKMK